MTIVPLGAGEIVKIWPRSAAFSLSIPQVRQAPSPILDIPYKDLFSYQPGCLNRLHAFIYFLLLMTEFQDSFREQGAWPWH
jgi:hypothetical protein